MDQKAMQQFRLDRRLIRRRGWIGREELARAARGAARRLGQDRPARGGASRRFREEPTPAS